jgi:hypothetical protein
MPPYDTKWLEIAPNGSKSVKQLNKNVKKFFFFFKEPKNKSKVRKIAKTYKKKIPKRAKKKF